MNAFACDVPGMTQNCLTAATKPKIVMEKKGDNLPWKTSTN